MINCHCSKRAGKKLEQSTVVVSGSLHSDCQTLVVAVRPTLSKTCRKLIITKKVCVCGWGRRVINKHVTKTLSHSKRPSIKHDSAPVS